MANGLRPELRAVLVTSGDPASLQLGGESQAARLPKRQTAFAAELAARVRQDAGTALRGPKVFRTAVEQLRGLA